jgi:hypothetical protein
LSCTDTEVPAQLAEDLDVLLEVKLRKVWRLPVAGFFWSF